MHKQKDYKNFTFGVQYELFSKRSLFVDDKKFCDIIIIGEIPLSILTLNLYGLGDI